MTNKGKGAKKKQSAPPQKKTKSDKRRENYRRVLLQLLDGKQYRPLHFDELAQKLSIIEEHKPELHEILEGLVNSKAVSLKNDRYELVKSNVSNPKAVRGIIRMNPRGFGFVEVEGLEEDDVFIPRHLTKNAMDGDSVDIIISPIVTEKGPEGRVDQVISRSRSKLVGIVISISKRYGHVHVPLLGKEQPVLLEIAKNSSLDIGDRIVMDIKEWGKDRSEIVCTFSKKIGHIDDPSIDIAAAIEEYDLRSDFHPDVSNEAVKFGRSVSKSALEGREDLRELETFTIDPDTAKDFDDALSLSKSKEIYHLAVHIADVSHYVKSGSELDKEAYLRANSTYFPGRSIPMLPRELSDNLCSLKPNVNRLTVTVFMDFDENGEMTSYRIARSVIRSQKRFTYKEARKVLDGKLKSIHKPTLELMQELCLLLKKRRYDRGSVEFAMPELVVLVDEKGVPTGTDYIEYDVTHQLVEEFMLKANETVARHLDNEGKGVPFRVHDEPSEENLRDFAFLAQAFGFTIPPKPSVADIQKLFDEAMDTPYGQYLATSYIRRMRLAIYSPVNIGHYGLSLTHYCHFTSPIRRYVDLVAHRLIFETPVTPKLLEKISDHCSDRERISAKAEMSVVLLKKYRLLSRQYKEDPHRQYNGVITKVKPFGFTFEIVELMLEGFIHVSEIGYDYYVFEEENGQLIGEKTGELFASGDKITVMLKECNLLTCESEWHLMRENPQSKPKKKKHRKG